MQEFIFKMIDDDTYAAMSYQGDAAVVEVPATYGGKPVTVLYDELFKGHTEITEVILHDTVLCLGGFLFDGCTNLKTLRLPESLTDMWQYCFVRSSIEIIEIPGSVTSIIPHTFEDCKSLTAVICHKGLKKIYKDAFKGCENLAMVAVPSETQVSHEAFEGCPRINPELKGKLIATCQCPKCRPVKGLRPFKPQA